MPDTGSHFTVSGCSTPQLRQQQPEPERIVDSPSEVQQAHAKSRGTVAPGAAPPPAHEASLERCDLQRVSRE